MKTTLKQLLERVMALPENSASQWRVFGCDGCESYNEADGGNVEITGISTDSRKVKAGDLFIALVGERFDAHDFLPQVQAVAAAVLVQRSPANPALPHLLVPDTRIALGLLARAWRAQFELPVIAVTGSNGKTTVKEMLSIILATAFGPEQRLATQGNLNNDIGVPLTLLGLRTTHRAAVVELGMNHPGEIASLAAMTQPTVALINNAQREHLEFMQDVAAVAQENGSVLGSFNSLNGAGVAVFPADDEFTPLWRDLAREAGARVLTFGLNHMDSTDADAVDVRCEYYPTEFGSDMRVTVKIDERVRMFPMKLAAAGTHNVRNALAATACAVAIGIDILVIARALESFAPVGGRLQLKTAANGAKLIDDTYNANPDSVRAAIAVLAQRPGVRILVLGDMGEVGNQGAQFHAEIGQFAKQQGIDQVFCLGTLSLHTQQAFGPQAQHFESLPELLAALDECIDPKATVLVKGSRFMKMERVVQHLLPRLAGASADLPLQEVH